MSERDKVIEVIRASLFRGKSNEQVIMAALCELIDGGIHGTFEYRDAIREELATRAGLIPQGWQQPNRSKPTTVPTVDGQTSSASEKPDG